MAAEQKDESNSNNSNNSNNVNINGPPPASYNTIKWRAIHPVGAGSLSRAPLYCCLPNVKLSFGNKWKYAVYDNKAKSKKYYSLDATAAIKDIDTNLKSDQIIKIIDKYESQLTWTSFLSDYDH
eukprot:104920_1